MQQPSYIPPFYENPSRSFIYSDELRNHILAVPQPFAVSARWPAKQFCPGYATCSSPRQIWNFFALFSAEEYRTASAWYLQTPDRWDSESHPYYSEPAPDSELYNLTREVYGVETLFQISLIRHPCKVEGLKDYVATNYHMQTPVITAVNKFMLDDVIVYALKPFYLAGEGRALYAGIIRLPVVFMCLLSSLQMSTNSRISSEEATLFTVSEGPAADGWGAGAGAWAATGASPEEGLEGMRCLRMSQVPSPSKMSKSGMAGPWGFSATGALPRQRV